ncbi:MAG TPA: 3'(2'),5'-bisphosphate nucleotidase CysQ [Thermomicrobiales bacterium]|nr:3'(2'),5'-bisphosphate nucleotidase CysQ [Thermomicrobiales bacterium]
MSTVPETSAWQQEVGVAIDAARQAAGVILGFYDAHTASTYTKGDGSPVTDADLASDKILRELIGSAFPEDGFLTEEGAQDLSRRNFERLWIIDPIDGTAQFIAGTGRFDILIALAVHGKPVLAVSMQPVTGLIHVAVKGEGAWRITPEGAERFRIAPPSEPARVTSSKYYRGNDGREQIVRIAEAIGAAPPPIMDVGFQSRAFDDSQRTYDAFIGLWNPPGDSAAHEWDIAAPDLIVNEAGGRLTDLWGREFIYNKRNTHISGGLLVSASPELHQRLLDAIAPELDVPMPALDPADDLDE